MKNRAPIPRDQRPPLPDFDPVPRKYRHDGWTPERQRAFIEALADTGCVSRAAAQVNMSQVGAYYLRRQKGAEAFRRAWEAALDFGVQRLKDIAFERAIEGQLVPVFVAGKLLGFRRKKNDRLLMFCLRHYGQDANGRRVTVNYFRTRATAGAATNTPLPLAGEGDSRRERGEGMSLAAADPSAIVSAKAEASTTTIKTITSGPGQDSSRSRLERDDDRAAAINGFEGVQLDDEAQAEILRVLEACATRRREANPDNHQHLPQRLAAQENDPDCDFIRVQPDSVEYLGDLESGATCEEFVPFVEGEQPWESIGEPAPEWFVEWERRQAELEEQASPAESEARGHTEDCEAIVEQCEESRLFGQSAPDGKGDGTDVTRFSPIMSFSPHAPKPGPDDPRLDWRNWESGEYKPSVAPPPAPDAAEGSEAPISPRTGKPLRRYRKRTPKLSFSPAGGR